MLNLYIWFSIPALIISSRKVAKKYFFYFCWLPLWSCKPFFLNFLFFYIYDRFEWLFLQYRWLGHSLFHFVVYSQLLQFLDSAYFFFIFFIDFVTPTIFGGWIIPFYLYFLGVKTPLQIAMVVCRSVCRSVCLSTILKCPPKSLKLASSSNRYHKVASDDNRWHHVSSDVIRWHQMTSDDIRWHQMTSEDIRWNQMTSDDIWWH